MTLTVDRAGIEAFRAAVARRLGLQFDDCRLDFLGDALRRRMEALRCERPEGYLDRLASPSSGREETAALAELLTVGESYFFRYGDNFRALAEAVLPDRARALAARRRLSVLSAGCASGEEPHTLAILLRERQADLFAGWEVTIRGIDINPAAVRTAARGRYSAWSLRETPEAVRERRFRASGREFALDDEIRAMVAFEERNLVEDDSLFWQPGAFDVIFCRNVIMYFVPEVARAVVARIARSLTPGGYLFLGHAETLRGLSEAFHLRHTHDTFYYQLRDENDRGTAAVPAAPAATAAVRPPPPVPATDTAWVDVIASASERIASLARGPAPAARAVAAADVPAARPRDLGVALELLRQERFADALDAVAGPGTDPADDPDARLLRAALLTHCGRLGEAEAACRALLADDDLNAGAHYVMALCREHNGDPEGAIEHEKTAVYLDPAFAMPHVHLGLLARRRGDREASRRELEQALALLSREDASRLLLFGGGFGREALVRLCREELRGIGGAP